MPFLRAGRNGVPRGFDQRQVFKKETGRPQADAPPEPTPFPIFARMLQHLIVLLLALAATGYLGGLAYRAFRADRGCASGCSKCAVQPLNETAPARDK